MVSEPPRPNVVIALSVETPWKPATTATLPAEIASRMRSPRISRIFAWRWAVSVTMPACEPVNETAGSPQSMIAMQSSAIEIRSPDGQQHVHLTGRRAARHVVGQALEVVGGLAHRRDDDHDVVTATTGSHDVLGDGADSIGVGDRGTAELLDQQAHGTRWYRRAPPTLGLDYGSVDSPAVPKATKRERQRINRELRREAMRKAEKRQKRMRTARNVGIAVVIVAVVFGVLKLIQGDDSSSSNAVTCANVKAGQGRPPNSSHQAPAMTIDQTSQYYVAVMDTAAAPSRSRSTR